MYVCVCVCFIYIYTRARIFILKTYFYNENITALILVVLRISAYLLIIRSCRFEGLIQRLQRMNFIALLNTAYFNVYSALM